MANRITSWINGYQRLGGRQGSVRTTPPRPDRDGPPGPANWMRPNTPEFRATQPPAAAPWTPPAPPPAAAPVPPPAPPPWETDPIYVQGVGAIDQQRNDAIAGLLQQLQTYGKNTGFGINTGVLDDADPNNDASALSVDTSNPFSRLNLLKDQYSQAQRGSRTSMAARGQLYSGALGRQQEHNLKQFQQQEHFTHTDMQEALQGFIRERQNLRNQHRTAHLALGSQATERAKGQLPPDPGDPNAAVKIAPNPQGIIGPSRGTPNADFVKGTEAGPAVVNRSGGAGTGSKHVAGYEMAALAYRRRTGRILSVQDFLRGVR
jgi:hypothetical protein